MTWHPLDDSRDAIDRAQEQFVELAAQVAKFIEDNGKSLTISARVEGSDQVLNIPLVPRMPGRWGTQVTEIANNSRQALDYLIYQLAIISGGDPEADPTAFPIAVDRDSYGKPGKRGKPSFRDRCLINVDEKWKREIDEFQPYNRAQSAYGHPLAVLNRLSNRGKHRMRNLPYWMIDTPAHRLSFEGRDDLRDVTIRYGGGNVDLEAAISGGAAHPGKFGELRVYPKSQPDGKSGIGIGFGDTRAGLGDIEDVIAIVRLILARFDPAFQPTSE